MWNIANLQKPRWQILSSGSGCKGHNRIVFSLSAGGEHFTKLISVSMDRQVRQRPIIQLLSYHIRYVYVTEINCSVNCKSSFIATVWTFFDTVGLQQGIWSVQPAVSFFRGPPKGRGLTRSTYSKVSWLKKKLIAVVSIQWIFFWLISWLLMVCMYLWLVLVACCCR